MNIDQFSDKDKILLASYQACHIEMLAELGQWSDMDKVARDYLYMMARIFEKADSSDFRWIAEKILTSQRIGFKTLAEIEDTKIVHDYIEQLKNQLKK